MAEPNYDLVKEFRDLKDYNCMQRAWDMALSSPCEKKKVGAVLATHLGHIMGRGYGGDTRGECTCATAKNWEWHFDKSFSIHAEMRALFDSFIQEGCFRYVHKYTMYVTHGPCDQCMKYMTYFGVPRVVYDVPYKVDYTKWLGRGIEVWHKKERII